MTAKAHWENVYSTKASDTVSWFQPHAQTSLEFIYRTGVTQSSALIDVGGGASTLIDDLLALNFNHLSVLDLSGAALKASQNRLGEQAQRVQWIEADITTVDFREHSFDLWHDRAVFHFLTHPEDRQSYRRVLLHALKPGGHLILATFADDGPEKCSGLAVQRYDTAALQHILGPAFTLRHHQRETHTTPFGTTQQFLYCDFQRTESENSPN